MEQVAETEVLPPKRGNPGFVKGHGYGVRFGEGQPRCDTTGMKLKTFKSRLLELSNKRINYKDISNKKVNGELGEAIATALYAKALKGDMKALNLILEYTKDKEAPSKGDTINNIGLVNVTDARSNIARVLELAARAGAASLSIEDELA